MSGQTEVVGSCLNGSAGFAKRLFDLLVQRFGEHLEQNEVITLVKMRNRLILSLVEDELE